LGRQVVDVYLILSDECMASIRVLIVDYSKLHIAHLMIIRDLAKEKGTLKYFGICGKKEFDKEVIKIYNINIKLKSILGTLIFR